VVADAARHGRVAEAEFCHTQKNLRTSQRKFNAACRTGSSLPCDLGLPIRRRAGRCPSPGIVERKVQMAITASFSAGSGQLTVLGDSLDNQITISRNAAGLILVNGGAVTILGGTPTVANTTLIQAFSQAGNDTITLDESNGALPAALLFGGDGNDILTG